MPPTTRRLRLAPGLLAAILPLAAAAQTATQRTAPNIGYVYPAGAQRGTTVTVSVGGEKLAGAIAAYSSIPGALLKVSGYDRPPSQKEITDARERVQELTQKRNAGRAKAKAAEADAPRPVWTEEDERRLADARALLAKRPLRLVTPAIAETVTLQVSLPPGLKSGDHELRIRTPAGLSNPVVFQVGDLPEITEPAIIGSVNPPALPAAREAGVRNPAKKSAREIKLPAVVNGQIMPGEVDRLRFSARQGQRLTLAVSARALIPYIADAVPGWFQATLALFDPEGRELAYDDDYRFNPDPVLACTIPTDGDYTIEIKDSIYRGREDFVYRLAIGELPFLTGIFPLGSGPQAAATFDLSGWNLPSDRLTIPADNRPPGTFLFAVRNQGQLSNPVRFAVDTVPEVMEIAQPNQTREQAQPLQLPSVINGRIEAKGDDDFYSFEGAAGQKIVAEVIARRLQSPLDSVLELTDAQGRRLAFNDDFDDKGAGLITHQADSRIMFELPAAGKYFLRIADGQHRGGAEYAYRLRVGPPQPDFELRFVPSTLNVRAGANAPATVYALRRDGFDGEILLGLKDAPRGFFLSGGRIPAGQDKVQVTVTAPPSPFDQPIDFRIVGQATVGERQIARVAVPADDMMQAFLYRHLVTAREFKVCVAGRGSPARLLGNTPLHLPAGGEARLQVAALASRGVNTIRAELNDPPEGISIKRTRLTREGFEIVFACDPAKAKPGLTGNLIVNAFGERPPAKAGKQPQRTPLGTLPAIPFEITAPLAKR
jgi:hypothetical protein